MVEARRVWKATHDASKTLAALRGFHCTERQLLEGLKRRAKNDIVTALSAVCSCFICIWQSSFSSVQLEWSHVCCSRCNNCSESILCLCQRLAAKGFLFSGCPREIMCMIVRDAPIIGRINIGWLPAVLSIISIDQLVCWYRPIVVCTVGKHKFLFLLPKVNKHESGFRFW